MTERKHLSLGEARELLLINKERLDEECEKQASLYQEIGEAAAIAKSISDEKKDALETLYSQLASETRANATPNEKLTEAKIVEIVSTNKKYLEAKEAYRVSKLETDLWGVMITSFSQKATMVKELCSLFVSGYFTSNTVTVNVNGVKTNLYNKTREEMAEKRREK